MFIPFFKVGEKQLAYIKKYMREISDSEFSDICIDSKLDFCEYFEIEEEDFQKSVKELREEFPQMLFYGFVSEDIDITDFVDIEGMEEAFLNTYFSDNKEEIRNFIEFAIQNKLYRIQKSDFTQYLWDSLAYTLTTKYINFLTLFKGNRVLEIGQ